MPRGGFPAHAGMDRRSGAFAFRCSTRRFPRPRGDGPSLLVGFRHRAGTGVSPPTRGWTLMRPDDVLHRIGGFPAHAGMDPLTATPATYCFMHGFPAHAGMDRRVARIPCCPTAPVSPPTRGWTRYVHDGRVRGDTLRWFPRPRGDGPDMQPAAARCSSSGVSPPTRGWTDYHLIARCRDIVAGFPAHAGMDRCPASFEQARGCRRGFPAHAGMDPILVNHRRRLTAMVSPPTRGWTCAQSSRLVSGSRHGFPAHAGMDPPSSPRTMRLS